MRLRNKVFMALSLLAGLGLALCCPQRAWQTVSHVLTSQKDGWSLELIGTGQALHLLGTGQALGQTTGNTSPLTTTYTYDNNYRLTGVQYPNSDSITYQYDASGNRTSGVIHAKGLEISVPFDIKPGSCPNPFNVRSKGVLPVAILGTAEFDINSIDASTVRLNGVSPLRGNIEDVGTPVRGGEGCACTTEGPDGRLDMTLKFDVQEVVRSLGVVNDRQQVALEITGKTLDGSEFRGKDCIIIKLKE